MSTDDLTERIARILNDEGWTFEGVHEPGDYDECEDCQRVVDPIAARIAGEVAAALDRVRELHQPCNHDAPCRGDCAECGQHMPCDTIRALDGDQ